MSDYKIGKNKPPHEGKYGFQHMGMFEEKTIPNANYRLVKVAANAFFKRRKFYFSVKQSSKGIVIKRIA